MEYKRPRVLEHKSHESNQFTMLSYKEHRTREDNLPKALKNGWKR